MGAKAFESILGESWRSLRGIHSLESGQLAIIKTLFQRALKKL